MMAPRWTLAAALALGISAAPVVALYCSSDCQRSSAGESAAAFAVSDEAGPAACHGGDNSADSAIPAPASGRGCRHTVCQAPAFASAGAVQLPVPGPAAQVAQPHTTPFGDRIAGFNPLEALRTTGPLRSSPILRI